MVLLMYLRIFIDVDVCVCVVFVDGADVVGVIDFNAAASTEGCMLSIQYF